MILKKIQDVDVKDQNVLVRVDFNVSLGDDGIAKESYKITAAKETVDDLVVRGARCVALLTHFGRPEGTDETLSTRHLMRSAEDVLGRALDFVPASHGQEVHNAVASADQGRVLLLENIRFEEGEKKNDSSLADKLAQPFDLYVNDAFAVCHRAHASVHAITKTLPSSSGLHIQKETAHLERVKTSPAHPVTAIIGGAKINTKLPLIKKCEETYDYVLVGGRVAVEAQEQKLTFGDNVILPVDYRDDEQHDIGDATVDAFATIIALSKTVVWNGPMGMFEQEPFDTGTREILESVADADVFSVVGGGESVQALHESDRWDDISFVSTGGGAMLAYLADDPMPGLEVLEKT